MRIGAGFLSDFLQLLRATYRSWVRLCHFCGAGRLAGYLDHPGHIARAIALSLLPAGLAGVLIGQAVQAQQAPSPLPASASIPASGVGLAGRPAAASVVPKPQAKRALTSSSAVIPARSTGTPGGIAWSELTRTQQASLQPLAAKWSGFDSTSRVRWVALADRMPSMSSDEQARVQARMTEWVKLAPTERARARVHFQVAQTISPAEQIGRASCRERV